MPRLRHTVEQILAKLHEMEVAMSKGQPVTQVCRTLAAGLTGCSGTTQPARSDGH